MLHMTQPSLGILRALRPVRGWPVAARYISTLLIVGLVFFAYASLGEDEPKSSFIIFIPVVILTAFIFDRGSGFIATAASGGLVLYYFIPSMKSFAVDDVENLVSLVVFVATGLFTAALIEALRVTVEDLAAANQRLEASGSLFQTVIEGTPRSDLCQGSRRPLRPRQQRHRPHPRHHPRPPARTARPRPPPRRDCRTNRGH